MKDSFFNKIILITIVAAFIVQLIALYMIIFSHHKLEDISYQLQEQFDKKFDQVEFVEE